MRTRRVFLKDSALAMFGIGSAPLWLARAASATGTRRKVLVAILQRGAMDGLNVVVPYSDRNYYSLRPSIAVPQAETLMLDDRFGLHPVLEPLKALYYAGQLAVVEAVGSPDPTRSHFDAQDYMESGTPGRKATRDGWLNRTLSNLPDSRSPVRAVSMGTNLARTIRGANPSIAVGKLGDFKVNDDSSATTFEDMYAATVDRALRGTGRDTFDAVKILQAVQRQSGRTPSRVRYPLGKLGQSLQQIASLIKADVGLEVAFADMNGWDTHVNEAGADPRAGQLANLLRDFGQSLGAFYEDLGDRMTDVVVVTMSEFGRTARENGSRGTDHGHANAMFVLGGGVRGGKVYGDWPGLAPEQLYEGRDLAVTTDFRDVLGEIVATHLGARDVNVVFPGYAPRFRGLLQRA